MRVLALIACAVMLGAAAPSQTAPPVAAPSDPQSKPQAAPNAVETQHSRDGGLTAYERESLATDRAANRIGERANSIADVQRAYALAQLILGAFGVAFTGIAAFFAYRATHWAKEAAAQTKRSADSDNEALVETRAASAEARKDAAEQSKRMTEQLRLADQTMQFTAKSAYAMSDSARETRALAKAMQTSADASTKQVALAESMTVKQLIAYVHAERVFFHWAKEGFPVFSIELANTGQTPAIRVRAGGVCFFGDLPTIARHEQVAENLSLGRMGVIGAKSPHRSTLIVEGQGDVRRAGFAPSNILAVMGRITYEDVFGGEYETEFGFFTSGPEHTEMLKVTGQFAMFRKRD